MDIESKLHNILSDGRFCILDNNKNGTDKITYIFHELLKTCIATSPGEVEEKLQEIEQLIQPNYYAVGYISYEVGYIVNPRIRDLLHDMNSIPLLCFGIYRQKIEVYDDVFGKVLNNFVSQKHVKISDCFLNMTKEQYVDRLLKVKEHIINGDTYQINYTLKYKFRHGGSPLKLYADLRQWQRVEYGAFLDFPQLSILSRSPELFVHKQGSQIYTKPMKGTRERGDTPEQDKINFDFLSTDEKSRAENVMIVDLLRNDLSRISEKGSVKTTDLFEVQTFETLHQMVSTISAKVDNQLTLTKLIQEIFPCGSITGAPKIRTMEIIRDLELEARGVYTGAIGYIDSKKNMIFNVPIRTLSLSSDGNGELGVGSGVVYDSDPELEYEECLLKGKFFTQHSDDFGLIESLYCDADGYRYLDLHMRRLNKSATFLGFQINCQQLESDLLSQSARIDSPTKVRLVLNRSGVYNINCMPIKENKQRKIVALSMEPVKSNNLMLQHKTTQREFYDKAYQQYSGKGYYDVVFTNEYGEVTEGTFNNIFIRKGAKWYTPPIECGVLPGVQRQAILASSDIYAQEMTLSVDDLQGADEINLTNSVRGMVPIEIETCIEESLCYT